MHSYHSHCYHFITTSLHLGIKRHFQIIFCSLNILLSNDEENLHDKLSRVKLLHSLVDVVYNNKYKPTWNHIILQNVVGTCDLIGR